MNQPLKSLVYIAGLLMLISSIYYSVGLAVAWHNQTEAYTLPKQLSGLTLLPCQPFKVDTIYNMLTDDLVPEAWAFNEPLVGKDGCPLNQEVVFEEWWDPITKHSEIIN